MKQALPSVLPGKFSPVAPPDGAPAAFRVSCTGTPGHVHPRLPEPIGFAKDAGKGTGQSLAFAPGFVVRNHRDPLRVEPKNFIAPLVAASLPASHPSPDGRIQAPTLIAGGNP